MSEIIPAAAFLRRRVPCLKKLNSGRKTRENLLMLLSWHSALNSICIVKNQGKIDAVGFARAISRPEEARNAYYVNENGRILYVENIAARTTEGMRMLLRFVVNRWPRCDYIMFHRSKNGSQNKIYHMNYFLTKAGVI